MPIINMSQRTLETLKPCDKQIEYYDRVTRGLALRVSRRSRTWVFSGKLADRSLRLTLGSFPAMGLKEAREEAEKTRHTIRRGEDPLAIRRAKLDALKADADNTFGALIDRFIDLRVKPHRRPRTVE